MNVRLCLILVIIVVFGTCDGLREKRRLITFRKMSKIFVRYNVKTNVVPYTSLFAYAMGFRGNWDVQPASILTPQKRYSQYPVPAQWSYPQYHQRALHDAVKGVFNWHGLNGNACLIRAICEAEINKHDDVISQAFSLVFNAKEDLKCPENIDCSVSLLHLIDHAINS